MKTCIVALVCTVVSFTACKGKADKSAESNDKADSTKFFETSVIINKDINEVDSTAFFIYKIVTMNGLRDSVVIDKAEFKNLANFFLEPDITVPPLKLQYKENIFEDQTTGGFTINYTANNKDLEIQSIDVLLKDDGKTVKNIFMRKFYSYPDSSAIEQLVWKPGYRFQIIRSVLAKEQKEKNQQILVVWNENIKE